MLISCNFIDMYTNKKHILGLIKFNKHCLFNIKIKFLGFTIYKMEHKYPKVYEKIIFIKHTVSPERLINIAHKEITKQLKKEYKNIYLISNNSGETSLMFASANGAFDQDDSLIIYTKPYHEQIISIYTPKANRIFIPDMVSIHQYLDCEKTYVIKNCKFHIIGIVKGFHDWESKLLSCDNDKIEHFFDNYKKFAIPFEVTHTQYPAISNDIADQAQKKLDYLNVNIPYVFISNESVSNENLSNEFYCKLVENIKALGYDVIFNSTYLSESNTLGHVCKFSIAEAIYIAKKAECVIGLRSGFMDIITPYAKHVVALYTDFKPRHPLPKLHAQLVMTAFTLKKLPNINSSKIDEIVIPDTSQTSYTINNILSKIPTKKNYKHNKLLQAQH